MEEHSKPMEYDFPMTDYYKHCILDGRTLAKTGIWWTALLLLEDPKSKKPFIGLYRWQKTAAGWKVRKRFSFHRQAEVKEVVTILEQFSTKLDKVPGAEQ